MKKRIAIIGAGPAGLSAAYHLQKDNIAEVTVFEKTDSPGGLCKSFKFEGHTVDLGPHRYFSDDLRINKFWLEVAQSDFHMVNRLTRIFYNNSFFKYPLEALDALKKMGFSKAVVCIQSYIRRLLFPHAPENTFEKWISNRFGDELFEIFFRPYSEKLWGITCDQLDLEFARQRIKKFSLLEAAKKIFLRTPQTHRTLIDEFAYPSQGTGSIYSKLSQMIIDKGGKIKYQSRIKNIHTQNQDHISISFEDMPSEIFDYVVSSMPLTHLISSIHDTPDQVLKTCQSLKFRSTVLVYLKLNKKHIFPDQWIYIQSEDLEAGRITNFSNWNIVENQKSAGTVILIEFWCQQNDERWNRSDQSWFQQAQEDLIKSGLVKDSVMETFQVIRIPNSYPIFDIEYKSNLDVIINHLKKFPQILPIGRYGSFKYNNQDHSLLMGMMAAENILEQKNNDLWAINCDTEYQEKGLITKTGLLPTSNRA